MTTVGIIAAILAVVFFWEIILKAILFLCAVLLAVALAAGALYLLWKFRRELWHGTCCAAEKIWSGICWAAPLLWSGVCWVAKTLRCVASWCWNQGGAVYEAVRNRSRKRLGAR